MLISAVTRVPLGTLLRSLDPTLQRFEMNFVRLSWILTSMFLSQYLVSKRHNSQYHIRAIFWMSSFLSLLHQSQRVRAGVRGLTPLVNQQSNEALWCYFSSISSCTRFRNWMLCDLGVKKGIIRQMNFDYNDYYEHNILITNIKDSAQRQ